MSSSSSSTVRPYICPSILSADFSQLGEECQRMTDAGAEWLHLDVMDGHFVPNITFSAPVISCVRKVSRGFFDCHLMVDDPQKWIDDFAAAGANQYTFHIEARGDPVETIKKIKSKGMRAGLAVKPKTPIQSVFPFLDNKHDKNAIPDMILIMTVEPGFGGQSFMSDMMPKVSLLRKNYPSIDIQVDGGITVDNIDILSKAGANAIVSGTGIFKAKDIKHAIDTMRKSVQKQIDANFADCQ